MIRVADYVAQGLPARGIRDVFMVTGAAAMDLNHAMGRWLPYVCVHYKQAASVVAQRAMRAHEPLSIDMFDNPYSNVPELKQLILDRGL